MSHLKGLRARLRSIVGTQSSESRMEEEFQFHVEMETKRLHALDLLGRGRSGAIGGYAFQRLLDGFSVRPLTCHWTRVAGRV